MLVALCPGCGSSASVALATPDHLACGACGYQGAPPADVSARLREAAAGLEREALGGRQLTDVQRRVLGLGTKAEGLLLGALLVLGGPFALMVTANMLRGLSGEGAEARRQLLAGCSYIPTLVVLGALGAVAFSQLRRLRGALEASCAALPPGRPGDPAGCRVCGGPVRPLGVEVVARCSFCRADNIVDPDVIQRAAPARQAQLGDYAAATTREARMLEAAGRSRALLWVAAVPLCTCLCGCPNLFLGYQLGLAESETVACENVLVTTADGRCVAELRDGLATIDGAPQPGNGEPISGARGMPRVRQRGTSRSGQVASGLARARACGVSVRVRWDDDAPTAEVPVAQLCWE